MRLLVTTLACLPLLAACASPQVQAPGQTRSALRLGTDAVVMDDGYRLPLRRWGRPSESRALLLGLHGFNDYGNAFAGLGDYLGERGVLVYAYDQRGFGSSAGRGRWAGEERMVEDLSATIRLLRARHPGLPLYAAGESMGGAVILAAAPRLRDVDGVVLIAPAVWSRDRMPLLQRLLLSGSAHTLPGLKLTGRGLKIRPTDNYPLWRDYSADPLVIKATRIDALWGVVNLMDRAALGARSLRVPTFLLYGEHDEIIPSRAFCALLDSLPKDARGERRLALYARGWHMLARDLQGAWVMADIAAWIEDPRAPLPSGEEIAPGDARLKALCGGA